MATATAVPIDITPEAAARIAELGLEKDIQAMIEHTFQAVPDLLTVELSRYDDPDEPGAARIVLTAWMDEASSSVVPAWKDGIHWLVRNFPSEVTRHVTFETCRRVK